MFKKISALFMAAVMIISFSIPSFAIENSWGIVEEVKFYANPYNENEYFLRVALIEGRKFDAKKEMTLYRVFPDGKEKIKSYKGDDYGSLAWDQTYECGRYAFLPVAKSEIKESETYSLYFSTGCIFSGEDGWGRTDTADFESSFTYDEMIGANPCLCFETAEIEATENVDFSGSVIYPVDFEGELYITSYLDDEEKDFSFSAPEEGDYYINLQNKVTDEVYGSYRVRAVHDKADDFGELIDYSSEKLLLGGVDLLFEGGSLLAGSLYAMVLPFLLILAIPLSIIGF